MSTSNKKTFRAGSMKNMQCLLAVLLLLCAGVRPAAAMQALSDDTLSGVTGQALLVADKFAASAISGAPSQNNGLTFVRMGLDVDLALNANINRFQLGCGGVNNQIVVGCDLDLSNVSFMGLNTGNNTGCGIGSTASGCSTSDFVLHRPYIELAVSGYGTTNQQLVGLNIGSQSATGFLSIGQAYASGATNKETNGACGTNGAVSGPGAGCESGINSFSGYVAPVLTGYAWGQCQASLLGLCPDKTVSACGIYGCYFACLSNGTVTNPAGVAGNECSGAPANTPASAITGTRLTSAETKANAWTNAGLQLTVTITLDEALAYIHGLALGGVPDFGISMERSQLAWPKYDKTGWNSRANTGWWMNLPTNVFVNIPGVQGPSAGLGAIFGITLSDLDLAQSATSNCWGSAKFC